LANISGLFLRVFYPIKYHPLSCKEHCRENQITDCDKLANQVEKTPFIVSQMGTL